MNISAICGKCGKVHGDIDDNTLIVDFKQKHITFICQNKQCKFDNIFSFETWSENSNKSPLPRMRMC